MVIVSEFHLVRNDDDNFRGDPIFRVESSESPVCPVCASILEYRDSRLRICRVYNGETCRLIVRRLKCPSCGRLHTELPDILTPHKHYATEVIENVADEVSTPSDSTTEDYPCERTMKRWIGWIFGCRIQIDSQLRAIGSRLEDFGRGLLFSTESLFDALRARGAGWLSAINRALYNSGGRIPFSPP